MPRRLISFDWALKRLLRSKAHFNILEGFLSELLREEIQILEILESESNKGTALEKHNRVDLKAHNSAGEIILMKCNTSGSLIICSGFFTARPALWSSISRKASIIIRWSRPFRSAFCISICVRARITSITARPGLSACIIMTSCN